MNIILANKKMTKQVSLTNSNVTQQLFLHIDNMLITSRHIIKI